MAMFADDLAWLCEQLEVKNPVIIGHSMGGVIATALAAQHPDLPGGQSSRSTRPSWFHFFEVSVVVTVPSGPPHGCVGDPIHQAEYQSHEQKPRANLVGSKGFNEHELGQVN